VWARYVQRVLPHPPVCSRAEAPDAVSSFLPLRRLRRVLMLQTRIT
jgi:hypothetical protein